jgi:uncharacterized membrane protein
MLEQLTRDYHLHPIVDHFTIALLVFGIAAEFVAAAAIMLGGGSGWVSSLSSRLRNASLLLMVGGAASAVLSYLTGDAEADRLWDTMSPGAQQILASVDGTQQYLSHAVLGQYLMYAFLILAAWRILMEFSPRLMRWRIAFLMAAAVAAGALLYQGKTGGELVYDHGVGSSCGGRWRWQSAYSARLGAATVGVLALCAVRLSHILGAAGIVAAGSLGS